MLAYRTHAHMFCTIKDIAMSVIILRLIQAVIRAAIVIRRIAGTNLRLMTKSACTTSAWLYAAPTLRVICRKRPTFTLLALNPMTSTLKLRDLLMLVCIIMRRFEELFANGLTCKVRIGPPSPLLPLLPLPLLLLPPLFCAPNVLPSPIAVPARGMPVDCLLRSRVTSLWLLRR